MPRTIATLLLIGLLLPLPALARPTGAHAPDHPQPQHCVPLGRWLLPGDGKTLPNGELLQRLKNKRVILLGEDHDNAQHHRWQLIVAAQLHALDEGLQLGFESFPRSVQPVLDRWVAGELDEARFLEESRWNEVWRYDARLYLPLFRFARDYRIPMLALNVERSLISRVGANGWASIPPEQRQGIGDPAPAAAEYLDLLARIYGRHTTPHRGDDGTPTDDDPKRHLDDPRFRHFVEGQLVWDRAMAEAIAEALRRGAPRIVAIAGAGHLMGGHGIPHQLADLGIDDVAVLLPWDGSLPCDALELPHLADAVFGLTPPERPRVPRPRLGVYLAQDAQGVRITKVTQGSIAEKIGLRPDDLIIDMAGRAVEEVKDVVERVQATQPGTWLPLTIRRGDQRLELIARFPARLPNAPTPPPGMTP